MRRLRRASLAAALLFSSPAIAAAQDTFVALDSSARISALDRRVSVTFKQTDLRQAIAEICDIAGLRLTFDDALAGLDRKVTANLRVVSARTALRRTLEGSGITARVSASGQVVLVAVPRVPPRVGPQALPAITTTAERDERVEFKAAPNVASITITGKELTSAPKFLGEADILRAIRMMPGVAARNDYSVGMNVRGGEADQNLILLDGYPVYNPFHLGGLFGSFVEPMVSRVDFFTGAFPASYGGRLSSVLDVHSKKEPRQGMHGTANLSIIATTLSLGSTLAGGKTSWLVAGRRTYADKVIGMFTDEFPPYHFRDIQTRVTHRLNSGWNVAATWYTNRDVLDHPGAAPTAQFDEGGGQVRISWGNQLLGTSLEKTWEGGRCLIGKTDSVSFRQDVSWSAFDMDMHLFNGALDADNTVKDQRYAARFTCYSDRHQRSTGFDLARQHFAFHANYPLVFYPADSLSADNSSAGVYYDELWRPNERWMVQLGSRIDAVRNAGRPVFQPRLSVKYFITPDLAVTAAAGTFAQWSHSLAREDVSIRALDFWTGSDKRAPVSHATHFIAGVERWFSSSRAIRVEAFLKDYSSLVEQNPFSDSEVPGDEFTPLTGRSFGADLMLRKFDDGGWNGWLAYSFAQSWRYNADGTRFRPGQDRRHEVNLVLTRTGPRYTRALRFNLASGNPFTQKQGAYERRDFNQNMGTFEHPDAFPQFIGGPRNRARLPLASRLDLSLTRNARTAHGMTISPFLSVMNAYNAQNPFAYVDDYTQNPAERHPLRQLPIFPTIGVSLAW